MRRSSSCSNSALCPSLGAGLQPTERASLDGGRRSVSAATFGDCALDRRDGATTYARACFPIRFPEMQMELSIRGRGLSGTTTRSSAGSWSCRGWWGHAKR